VRGPDDLDAAVAVELQYQLVPLNRYGTVYIPPTDVPFRAPDPDFVPPSGLPVTSAPGFQSPEFFQAMKTFIRTNQPPRDQWPLVDSFQPVIAQPGALTPQIVEEAQDAMHAAAEVAGISVNGWSFSLDIGSYGAYSGDLGRPVRRDAGPWFRRKPAGVGAKRRWALGYLSQAADGVKFARVFRIEPPFKMS
jgi:hypothetical protein